MSYVLWSAGGLVHCSEEGIWAELHGVHHHRDEMPIASLLITYTKSVYWLLGFMRAYAGKSWSNGWPYAWLVR